ncbi:DUF2637 domain-containing protein [Virgisporangium aurantiacum]|uniref:DUF2637 domain-containing protein n=1 Tax=Virgisporangium aurantiacum TaxID=175570 RepID=A0A8J3ZDQ9_9ACTN|nr:hypothetical protein Vau01_096180 [Virgisporangium aurantiacum]
MSDVRQLKRLRWGVRAVLSLGVGASVCANVLHAQPHLISQAIAAWPPVALLLTVELISRVPVHRRWLAVVRRLATAAIAGIAAWVSYWHMAGVAARYGETGASAYLLPLSVDGLILVGSVCLMELGGRLATASPAAATTGASGGSSDRHADPVTVPTGHPNGRRPVAAVWLPQSSADGKSDPGRDATLTAGPVAADASVRRASDAEPVPTADSGAGAVTGVGRRIPHPAVAVPDHDGAADTSTHRDMSTPAPVSASAQVATSTVAVAAPTQPVVLDVTGHYEPVSDEDAAMYELWRRGVAAGQEPSGADLARAAGRANDASGVGRKAARRYREAHAEARATSAQRTHPQSTAAPHNGAPAPWLHNGHRPHGDTA